MQDTAERAILRLVSASAARAMEGAKVLAWLPPAPLPSGSSAYVVELIKMLKVCSVLLGGG